LDPWSVEWDLRHLAGKLPLGWKDSHGAILKTKIIQVLGCGIIGDSHVSGSRQDRRQDGEQGTGQELKKSL
jgi:hypothetical protein